MDKDKTLSKHSGQVTVLLWQLLYSKTSGRPCNVDQLEMVFREADVYSQPAVKTAIGDTALLDCTAEQVHWLIFAVSDLITKAQYRLLLSAIS
jgi:hypothetical protein